MKIEGRWHDNHNNWNPGDLYIKFIIHESSTEETIDKDDKTSEDENNDIASIVGTIIFLWIILTILLIRLFWVLKGIVLLLLILPVSLILFKIRQGWFFKFFWLKLVALWLVWSSIITAVLVVNGYSDLVDTYEFELLSNEYSPSHLSWYSFLVFIDLISSIIFWVIMPIYLLYLLYYKNKKFPKYMIRYLWLLAIFKILDQIVANILYWVTWYENIIGGYILVYIIVGSYILWIENVGYFVNSYYNKQKLLTIISIAMLIYFWFFFASLNFDKINLSKTEVRDIFCKLNYGDHSYYVYEDNSWKVYCDCEDWYEFWWPEGNTCVQK